MERSSRSTSWLIPGAWVSWSTGGSSDRHGALVIATDRSLTVEKLCQNEFDA
jgi:hypothetical protein